MVKYFENSPQRNSVLAQVTDNNDSKNKKLKQLCRTRWAERIASYDNLWNLFEEVSVSFLGNYIYLYDFYFICYFISNR